MTDPVKALLEALDNATAFLRKAREAKNGSAIALDNGDGLSGFVLNHHDFLGLHCALNDEALSRAASVLREREGGEDYYPSHEALVDLVSLLGERDAIGGGPGFAERWKKAYDNACDLVRVEP